MSKLAILFAGVVTLAVQPAFARDRGKADAPSVSADTTMDGSQKTVAVAAVSDRQQYCIVDTPTGTRIVHKICKTRAAWLDEGFDPLVRTQ